jgi:hypothetical protein
MRYSILWLKDHYKKNPKFPMLRYCSVSLIVKYFIILLRYLDMLLTYQDQKLESICSEAFQQQNVIKSFVI